MNQYSLELLTEKDTHEVFSFIDENLKNDESNAILMDCNLCNGYYNELIIRYGLYNFEEEYVALKIEDKNYEGVISFNVPKDKSRVFNLNLLIIKNFSSEKIKMMLDFALEQFYDISLVKPSKIRINLKNNTSYFNFWRNTLYGLGFITEVIRDKEFEESLVFYLNNL